MALTSLDEGGAAALTRACYARLVRSFGSRRLDGCMIALVLVGCGAPAQARHPGERSLEQCGPPQPAMEEVWVRMPGQLVFPMGGSQLDARGRETIELIVQGVAAHDEITAVRFEGHAVSDEARLDGPRSEAELRSLARARAEAARMAFREMATREVETLSTELLDDPMECCLCVLRRVELSVRVLQPIWPERPPEVEALLSSPDASSRRAWLRSARSMRFSLRDGSLRARGGSTEALVATEPSVVVEEREDAIRIAVGGEHERVLVWVDAVDLERAPTEPVTLSSGASEDPRPAPALPTRRLRVTVPRGAPLRATPRGPVVGVFIARASERAADPHPDGFEIDVQTPLGPLPMYVDWARIAPDTPCTATRR